MGHGIIVELFYRSASKLGIMLFVGLGLLQNNYHGFYDASGILLGLCGNVVGLG